MSDLISREAAIEEIARWIGYIDEDMILRIQMGLKKLPSAQPERKKGRWIIRNNPGTGWYRVTCSECSEDVTSTIPMIGFFPNAKPLWDYCPWCGARMKGEEDE